MLESLQQGGEVVEVDLLQAHSDGADPTVAFFHVQLRGLDDVSDS